jgi:hypothetical protein
VSETRSQSEPRTEPPKERVGEAFDLVGIDALWTGQLCYTAAEVGIFDALTDESLSAADLAAALDLDPDATYRLLRILDHYEVLREEEGQQFALTDVAELFTADHPQSVRHGLELLRSPEWVAAMSHLPDIVREGAPDGFEREFGRDVFEYAAENPAFGERFDQWMTTVSRRHSRGVLEVLGEYDFSMIDTVCDVGGGRGHFLCHLLSAHPHLEGTILDRPGVAEEAPGPWAAEMGVADRCGTVGGDMFEAVPDADAYLAKYVLHDWSDAECVEILSTIRDAVQADGRLFVVEAIVPESSGPHWAKRLDATMLVQMGGRERTEAEYEDLLARADWDHVETHVPDEGPLSVIETSPA